MSKRLSGMLIWGGIALLIASLIGPVIGQVGPVPGYGPLPVYRVNPTLTFCGSANSTTPATTFNFTSSSLCGTVGANRTLIMGFTGTQGAGAPTISSASGDGISATVCPASGGVGTQCQVTGAVRGFAGFAFVPIPNSNTDTTGTLSVTYSAGISRMAVGWWVANNLLNQTVPTATNFGTTTTTSQSETLTLNMVANAIAIGVCYDNGDNVASPTPTWVGVTQRYNQNPASDMNTGADATAGGAQLPLTITCTASVSGRGAAASIAMR